MKKIFIILALTTITQGAFAGECQQFFLEMTKKASEASKALVNESFRSSHAINEYINLADGPGPGALVQANFRGSTYNADVKLAQAYINFQNSVNDRIKKHANCFSKEELVEILDQ